jgi:hypothetical protein
MPRTSNPNPRAAAPSAASCVTTCGRGQRWSRQIRAVARLMASGVPWGIGNGSLARLSKAIAAAPGRPLRATRSRRDPLGGDDRPSARRCCRCVWTAVAAAFRSRTRRVALQIVAATLLCGFAATKGRAKRAPGDGWRREWDSSPRRRAKRVGSCLKPAQLRLTSRSEVGGESGIRTHGRVSPTHAFQACLIDRSSISPL